MLTSTVLLLAVAVLCNCSGPITLEPKGDVVIPKTSNDNVTFNCTFLSTTGHDSSSILWKIGNATLLDRDQYAQFGVNALDSSNRKFSQLFFSPAGRMWLFGEIEEMNVSVQCLGSERGFVVTEVGPVFSIVVCDNIPKVRNLRVDLVNGRSVVSWNRPSIYQPLDLKYTVAVVHENGTMLYEWNTTTMEQKLPENYKCDICRVSVQAQNTSCDRSETAVWSMGPIPVCFTLQPLTQSLIKYTCDSGQNQKATVTFPGRSITVVVNRTVTVTARGVVNVTEASGGNASVEITGLMKQARYYVVVTMCTNICCRETKPVILSTSCVKNCSIQYYRRFIGIKCDFSEVQDASSNDTGVQLVFTINGERETVNAIREVAIAGFSPSRTLLAGTDVRVYDWNPRTNDTGSVPIQASVTTVTDREDFNFPIETEVLTERCPDDDDDDEPCGTLCVGLIVGIGALILGALLGIIFTFVVFKCCCKSKEEISRGLPLKDKY